jgi:hypothetical protein
MSSSLEVCYIGKFVIGDSLLTPSQERLKNNSSAFDGLLSLIPAKYYYDEDTQEQWKAKKQTKEEAKKNKRAKLDPSQSIESEKAASASEILKKRAKTAKPVVIPGQKKPVLQAEPEEDESESSTAEISEQGPIQQAKLEKKATPTADESEDDINLIFDDDGNEIEQSSETTPDSEQTEKKNKKKSKELSEEEKKKKEESIRALRDKLTSKIDLLKEKRKAPGSKASGAPSSREAILEERRKKAEARAEKKRKLKEMQHQDGSEEEDDDDSDEEEVNDAKADGVIYQNIVFDDATRATSDLQNLRTQKKKGPAKKDLRAHLKLLEQKKQKVEQMDDEKKKEFSDKDKWNRTIAQAEGQKLRDDEKLLKKALKRKEALKRRSEIEWKDRKDHVENMISAKAKRREENLAIRKANKGVKRKHQIKQLRTFKTSVAPKRAGFEGRRRSKK